MRRPLLLLAVACSVALSACTQDEPSTYSESVRKSFLASCLDNATRTSKGAVTPEQLRQTCRCILGKVEAEYSQEEFTEFEGRLLGGRASDEESGRLVGWSTDCAKEATR